MLQIQHQNFVDSLSLRRAFLSCCADAIEAGGSFAFVTDSAIEMIFNDDCLENLLTNGQFYFLAGVDDITTEKALRALTDLSNKYNGFVADAFLSKQSSLFHPKYCWFKQADNSGHLLIGSGNFTLGGLVRNSEAYALLELNNQELNQVIERWEFWLDSVSNNIKCLDDTDILEKVRKNQEKFQRSKVEKTPHTPSPSDKNPKTQSNISDSLVENEEWQFSDINEVLITEIPRAADRWSQGNFSKKSFEDFFGARPFENQYQVILRHVDELGSLGDIENRKAVSSKSRNWRFEIGAAESLNYPSSGRPIGVFIKLGEQVFIYSLLMPGQKEHNIIAQWVQSNTSGSTGKMRRTITNVKNIRNLIDQIGLGKFAN